MNSDPQRRTNTRRAAAAPWLLLSLPILGASFSLAVHVASWHHTQLELQIAADAATLAGANAESPALLADPANANALVADILLTARGDRLSVALSNAQDAALAYGLLNPVRGAGLTIAANLTNDPNGEVVFGTRDGPTAAFVPLVVSPLPAPDLYNPQFNAVAVQVQRSNVRATANAYLDRDVIGFQVSGSSDVLDTASVPNTPAIPVVPFAILTDYTHSSPNPKSWEYNIINRGGQDNFTASASGVVSGADGIPEITVRISGNTSDNGQMVAIAAPANPSAVGDALTQITDGITGAQLSAYDPVLQQLSLYNSTTNLNQQSLPQLVPQSSDLTTLQANLIKIKGERRVWMLFDGVATAGMSTQVNVVGFVAARVMDVSTETDSGGGIAAINVTLQPTMLLTSTALTDRTKRQLGPRTVSQSADPTNQNSIFNPYIARVRLVN